VHVFVFPLCELLRFCYPMGKLSYGTGTTSYLLSDG